jgi:hypothetical protein
MSLPLLNWKFVGTKTVAKPALAGGLLIGSLPYTLDAIYQLGALTTYADGSARVPGTGSAWTWAQDGSGGSCVATYGVPATVTAVGMKYILAGNAVTGGYTKLTPDTGVTTGNLLIGMNRSSGAYAGAGAWALPAPFTTASSFSGYYRFVISPFPTNPGIDTVSMWECQEACVIQVTTFIGTSYSAQFGALYDPLTYTPGVTCETDNRLYGMITGGSTVGSALLSSTVVTEQAYAATPATSNPRAGYFLPGTITVDKVFRGGSWTPSTTFVNPAGRLAQYPFWAQNSVGQFIGAARNFFIVRDAPMQSTMASGGAVIGYTAGYTAYQIGAGDTVILGT